MNILRAACICILFALQALGCGAAFAQRLLPGSAPPYPLKKELFRGIIMHEGEPVQAILSYDIIHGSDTVLRMRSDSFTITQGIHDWTADSIRLNTEKQDLHYFTDTNAYLRPGAYLLHYRLATALRTQEESTPFHVDAFTVSARVQGDTAFMRIDPALNNVSWYLSVLSEKDHLHKRFQRSVSYGLRDSLALKKKLMDSTMKEKMRYRIHAFVNGKLVAQTAYVTWEDLAHPDQSSATVIDNNDSTAQKRQWVSVNGRAAVEYGYSNIRFPNQLSAPQYLRFYFQPTISVFGIPMTLNTMFSTENNTIYPVNTFGLSFNAGEFKQQFSRNALGYQLETERNIQVNHAALQQVNKELAKEKIRLSQLSRKPGVDLQLPEDTFQRPALPDTPAAPKKPVLNNRTKKQVEQAEARIRALESQQFSLEQMIRRDSLMLLNRGDWNNTANDTLQRFINRQRFKGFTKALLSVQRLDIGLSTPYYSSITLAQTPMQGIHTEIDLRNVFFSATYGYMVSTYPLLGMRTIHRPEFNRNITGARIGYGQRSGNNIYLSYHYFSDGPAGSPASMNELSAPKKNHLLSVGALFRPLRMLTIEGEVAKSFYATDSRSDAETHTYLSTDAMNRGDNNTAFNTKAIAQLTQNTKLEAAFKQIGTGYYSSGIPFLRNDYREYQLTWQQYYWFRQISTELYYKDNRDNLLRNKTHTTVLQGYGATLRTAFRRWPNLIVSYQPFNMQASYQSNQFSTGTYPELITQQFSVFTGTVIYRKTIQRNELYATGTYTRSDNEDQRGIVSGLQTWIANAQWTTFSKQQFFVTYSFTNPKPYLAMNTMHWGELAYGFPIRRLQNKFGYNGQWIADGRQRQGAYYQAGASFGQLNVNLRAGFNFLQGNWNLGQPTEQTLRALVEYFF